MACATHKITGCDVCARYQTGYQTDQALRRFADRSSPVFRNGRMVGTVSDMKAGQIKKGAAQ
jgi:hypothetical protein